MNLRLLTSSLVVGLGIAQFAEADWANYTVVVNVDRASQIHLEGVVENEVIQQTLVGESQIQFTWPRLKSRQLEIVFKDNRSMGTSVDVVFGVRGSDRGELFCNRRACSKVKKIHPETEKPLFLAKAWKPYEIDLSFETNLPEEEITLEEAIKDRSIEVDFTELTAQHFLSGDQLSVESSRFNCVVALYYPIIEAEEEADRYTVLATGFNAEQMDCIRYIETLRFKANLLGLTTLAQPETKVVRTEFAMQSSHKEEANHPYCFVRNTREITLDFDIEIEGRPLVLKGSLEEERMVSTKHCLK